MKNFTSLSLALVLLGLLSTASAHDRDSRDHGSRDARQRLEARLDNLSDRYTRILAGRHTAGTTRHIEGEVGQISIDLRKAQDRVRSRDFNRDRAEDEVAQVESAVAHVERELNELRGSWHRRW